MEKNDADILIDIIEKRRSYFPKNFSGGEISDEVIQQLLKVGQLAPNHKKTKPWRYQVFKGYQKDNLAKELQDIYRKITPPHLFLQKKYDDILFKIAKTEVIIVIICEKSPLVPEWEDVASVAMGVQNMYLLCTALGLGCYWSSSQLLENIEENFKLNDNQQCLGLFYLGDLQKKL